MAAPFTTEPQRGGWIDRLLRRHTEDAGASAVRAVLASADRIRDVSASTVQMACARHGVPDVLALGDRRGEIYRAFLRHCFADHRLSDEELSELDHLRGILRLTQASVELIHRRVARDVYARSVDDVLADDTIDTAERAFLSRLRERLEIPESVAENILHVKQRQRDSRRSLRE